MKPFSLERVQPSTHYLKRDFLLPAGCGISTHRQVISCASGPECPKQPGKSFSSCISRKTESVICTFICTPLTSRKDWGGGVKEARGARGARRRAADGGRGPGSPPQAKVRSSRSRGCLPRRGGGRGGVRKASSAVALTFGPARSPQHHGQGN